jgi:hypothetical protein
MWQKCMRVRVSFYMSLFYMCMRIVRTWWQFYSFLFEQPCSQHRLFAVQWWNSNPHLTAATNSIDLASSNHTPLLPCVSHCANVRNKRHLRIRLLMVMGLSHKHTSSMISALLWDNDSMFRTSLVLWICVFCFSYFLYWVSFWLLACLIRLDRDIFRVLYWDEWVIEVSGGLRVCLCVWLWRQQSQRSQSKPNDRHRETYLHFWLQCK